MDTVLRNVCWLSPPEPPIFDNTAEDAKKRMLNFRESCSAYQKYTSKLELIYPISVISYQIFKLSIVLYYVVFNIDWKLNFL